MFRRALKAAKAGAEKALNSSVSIAATSHPTFFNHTSQNAIFRVVESSDLAFQRLWHVIKASYAYARGYELCSCSGLGLPNDCDALDIHDILVVGLNSKYMELLMLEADTLYGGVGTRGSMRFPELGEDSRHVSGQLDSSFIFRIFEKFLRNNAFSPSSNPPIPKSTHGYDRRFDEEAYYEKIEDAIRSFLASYMPGCQSDEIVIDSADFEQCNSLKAIVMTGDATPLGFRRLRERIANIIPRHLEHTWVIKRGIDPMYVGAMGAAFRGRELLTSDEPLGGIGKDFFVPQHDEF